MNEGIPEFAMERPVSDCPSKAKSERAAQTISSNLSSTAATRERLPGVIDAGMFAGRQHLPAPNPSFHELGESLAGYYIIVRNDK